MEISLRKVLGKDVEKQDVKDIDKVVSELFIKGKEYQTAIKNAFDNLVYNHGTASVKGAKYILYSLKSKRENQTAVKEKGE